MLTHRFATGLLFNENFVVYRAKRKFDIASIVGYSVFIYANL